MINLSERLSACAKLVEKGSRIADIGCDHGYLPVFLVKNDIAKSAVASDINEGPLSSCRELVRSEGLESKIKCVLSNGFDAIDKNGFDTAILAGMGGDLIADILNKCKYINNKHIILNPMTHSEKARKWLFENGFEIQNDFIVKDSKHYYSILDAVYTGRNTSYDNIKLFLGEIKDFSHTGYFLHLKNYLENKQKGGENFEDIIAVLKEKINDNR